MDQRVLACCDGNSAESVDVDSAAAIVARAVEAIDQTEMVPLRKAAGRILRRDIHSGMALPPFDHSAVDGFGFGSAEISECRTSFLVSGRIAAGDPPSRLHARTAVHLMTGAPIPAGCDAVLKQEHVPCQNGRVELPWNTLAGTNIRRVGEDVAAGDLLLQGGTLLDARHVALLAACGVRSVEVVRRVRIVVAAFGNELRRPGYPLRPGQIFDSNTPMVAAFVSRPWTRLLHCIQMDDHRGRAAGLLRDLAGDADLIITSGGMANGEEDHTRLALQEAGGMWLPLAIRMKPGKPSGFGRIGSTIVLGLPGNPFAALVGLVVLGIPMLSRLTSTKESNTWLPVRSAFHLERRQGRVEFFPARLCGATEHGALTIQRLGKGGSARLRPLIDADGLGRLEAGVARVVPGDSLTFLPFAHILG